MAIDREILPADDSSASTTVVFDSNGGVAIDYSTFYERIATAMETIASSVIDDSTTISTEYNARIATATETIATTLSSIETLASGTGIKTQGVYDWVLLSSVYKIYVDDAGAIGLESFTDYKDKIESLPKS